MSFSLGRILDWLRAGYPQGVPQEDYIALFGVLHRHLTEDEIVAVANRIRAKNGDAAVGDEEIRRRIERHLKGHADEQDVRRVAARLAMGGWPLAAGPAESARADGTPDAGLGADATGTGAIPDDGTPRADATPQPEPIADAAAVPTGSVMATDIGAPDRLGEVDTGGHTAA